MRTTADNGRTVISMLTAYHASVTTGDRVPLAYAYEEFAGLDGDERVGVFDAAIGYLHGATTTIAQLHGLDFDEVVQAVAIYNEAT